MINLFLSKLGITLTLFLCTIYTSCDVFKHSKSDSSIHSTKAKSLLFPRLTNGYYNGFLDSKNNLWFCSRGGGIFLFDGSSITNFTTENGLLDNSISCFLEDQNGFMWFGGSKGLYKFDGEKFYIHQIPQSDTSSTWLDLVYPVVNPNQILSLLEDKLGNIWIGTNGAGVYKYDGHTYKQYLSNVGMIYDDGLQHNIVLSMVNDHDDNIWFSSLSHGGISRYDGQSFTHFVEELSDDFIRIVYCDSKNRIWVGTHGNHNGGFDLYDHQSFTSFHKTNDGFAHNNVSWVYEDKKGILWLGSGTTNMTLFDGQHFTDFKDQNGHTYPNIHFIVEDDKSNIWFGGKNGLWQFDGVNTLDMIKR